ncbi:C-type lectin domain family 4 member G-like [Mya arenaria]|uniref:C-type lectin domain family 4 member G-like n=1 Tax=Mya arenaria TaxID=6604 RepID=UPI0022E6259D|nr:C-type lectin domain family 4 member G-like [Mya arenaria]
MQTDPRKTVLGSRIFGRQSSRRGDQPSKHRHKRCGWWKVKPCPPGWLQFEKSCYLFSNETSTWDAASQHCAHVGGYLATVNSLREHNFTADNRLYQENDLFVGGRRSEDGSFQWVNGESMEFTHWGEGEPSNTDGNQNCLQLRAKTNGLWDDQRCDETIPNVCEKAMFG